MLWDAEKDQVIEEIFKAVTPSSRSNLILKGNLHLRRDGVLCFILIAAINDSKLVSGILGPCPFKEVVFLG